MFLIVGLGNPGIKYAHTRHNAGFDALDLIAEDHGIDVRIKKHKALIGKGVMEGQSVLLAKPQTYMNLSGESVAEILDYYHLDPEQELLVLSDDITLPVGMVRIRRKGSAGGHNGLKNIIEHCHTSGFARIKIGVGDVADHGSLISHVLGHCSPEDRDKIRQASRWAADAAVLAVQGRLEQAMNEYNGRMAE